ncbi:ACT domain-containing protein, partial [Eubacterium aggregans]
ILDAFKETYPQVEIEVDQDVTKLSVVGIGMRSECGVAAKFFKVLSDLDFPILMITTSEIRISCMIPVSAEKRAVQATAEAFDL